jgi:hypothetical protein
MVDLHKNMQPKIVEMLIERRKFQYRDDNVIMDVICEYFAIFVHFFLLTVYFVGLLVVSGADALQYLSSTPIKKCMSIYASSKPVSVSKRMFSQ